MKCGQTWGKNGVMFLPKELCIFETCDKETMLKSLVHVVYEISFNKKKILLKYE